MPTEVEQPAGIDFYAGYQERQEQGSGKIRKKDSPIIIGASIPGIWETLEKMLRFRSTYAMPILTLRDPAHIIQVARDSVSGYYDWEVADAFGIEALTVLRSRNLVERMILIAFPGLEQFNPSYHAEPSPKEKRALEICNRFQTIKALLDDEISVRRRPLGFLLKRNPHVVYCLEYFFSGRSVADLMNFWGTTCIKPKTMAKSSERVVDLLMDGESTKVLHKIARTVLFAKFAWEGWDWRNTIPWKSIGQSTKFVLTTPPHDTANHEFFATLRIFLELVPALHLALMLEEEWDEPDIISVLPGLDPLTSNPMLVDPLEYFTRYHEAGDVSQPLRVIAWSFVANSIDTDIVDRLRRVGIKYDKSTIRTCIGAGYRLLENILLSYRLNDSIIEQELLRSRYNELATITGLLCEKVRELNAS